MHPEILAKKQEKLLPLIAKFSRGFGLAGGTAIALYIGHRRSIDFDLFSLVEFHNPDIRKKIVTFGNIDEVIRDESGQYTLLIDGVRVSLLHYPFKIEFKNDFENIISLPDLLTLAAMKAYALGRRAKWKDYVDLYFIIKEFHSIEEIIQKTKQIFGAEFNEKNFREQLVYFKDIDFSEAVDYLPGFEVSESQIKRELVKFSMA